MTFDGNSSNLAFYYTVSENLFDGRFNQVKVINNRIHLFYSIRSQTFVVASMKTYQLQCVFRDIEVACARRDLNRYPPRH